MPTSPWQARKPPRDDRRRWSLLKELRLGVLILRAYFLKCFPFVVPFLLCLCRYFQSFFVSPSPEKNTPHRQDEAVDVARTREIHHSNQIQSRGWSSLLYRKSKRGEFFLRFRLNLILSRFGWSMLQLSWLFHSTTDLCSIFVPLTQDNQPNVWFSVNGERLGTYRGHGGAVWCLDVNYDTTKVLTGTT